MQLGLPYKLPEMSTARKPATGFFLHPAAPLHDPGWGHPEHQGRLRSIASAVGRHLPELHGKVEQLDSGAATPDQLSRVHPRSYLSQLEAASVRAEGEGGQVLVGPETPLSGGSWEAILGSAGAAIEAVERVAREELQNAFVATRPPGHHASAAEAMGFCTVNHVAVGARHLQAKGLARNVAVIDWDAHHGNGTQNIFYEDPSVYYVSLHQSPLFPGTGAPNERGQGDGQGTTLNVPLAAGTERREYFRIFSQALERVEREFQPDFVLVSAGYDALAQDPLAGLLLEPEDFLALTRRVTDWANRTCSGRIALFLEGGYHPQRTGSAVVSTLSALCSTSVD